MQTGLATIKRGMGYGKSDLGRNFCMVYSGPTSLPISSAIRKTNSVCVCVSVALVVRITTPARVRVVLPRTHTQTIITRYKSCLTVLIVH